MRKSTTGTVRSWTRRGALGGFLAATLLAAACGGGGGGGGAAPSSGGGAPEGGGIPADAVSITATPQTDPLPQGTPGTGKPAVVIGSKNFAEQTVLGELYTQALKAKGYNVSLKASIGGSELIDKSLESNQIQLFPEYLGETVTSVAKLPAPTSASDTYNKAKQWLEQNRQSTVLKQTAFEDTDGIIVTTQYAQEKGLETISDLNKVGPGGQGVTVSGPPEFQNRETGLVGMKKAYNLPNVGYLPAPAGSQYTAVDQGSAQAANAFTTDYQLTTGKYKLLTDPQAVFGFQYVAPIVKQSVIQQQGPEFSATLNWVSGLLTEQAIQALNQQVQGNNQPAPDVAKQFLAANGLQ
ncbi:glycine betaine ABC transporter substrate-binding protein [Pseudonocardia endophytica]|uniref:Osmoprotectant transport system substrate-binding protein n=1 Tax=Pseudonocardia endophytica TaxID=401976 RepID=A0A4R1HXW9_PSEEN|nr:glycine betaine ABC transporter substrate-binding protein [Pseudonocardia endophytica]TCK24919.1 osmoprotectant transport system substrate-binding protein [Pseudonocardia endophytica]